jgi:hypothetical protein
MPEGQGQRQIKNKEVSDLMQFVNNFLSDMEGSKVNKYSINGFWIEANQYFVVLEDTLNALREQQNKKDTK